MDNVGYIVAAYGVTFLTLMIYWFWLWRTITQVKIEVRGLKALEDRHEP